MATWTVRDDTPAATVGGLATATFVVGCLSASVQAPLLVALSGTVLACGLAVAFTRRDGEGGTVGPAVLAASATLVGAGAVAGWARVLGAEDVARAVALAVVAAVVAVLAAPVARDDLGTARPRRRVGAGRRRRSRRSPPP